MPRLLVCALALLACFPPAAAASPAAATVEVAREGDRLVVTGDGDSVQLSMYRTGGYGAPEDIYVGLAHGEVRAGPGCRAMSTYSSHCAGEGLRSVVVRTGRGYDQVGVGELGVPLDAELGDGGDVVTVASPLSDRIDGGAGQDSINYAGRSAGVRAHLDGTPGGEDVLIGVEGIMGTTFDDELRGGPGPDTITGAAGADRIDVRGGGADVVVCGGDEGDVALIDGADDAHNCAQAIYEPAREGQSPIVRRRGIYELRGLLAGEGGSEAGLLATPTLVGDELVLLVRGAAATTASARLAVAPWRDPAAVSDLAPVEQVVGADGVAQLRTGLPGDLAAVLRDDGRMRLRLALRVSPPAGRATTRTGVLTVVVRRPWRHRLTGARRRGGFGVQRLVGTPLGDLLTGMSADDRLLGGDGDDRLLGGTGDDTLLGEGGRDGLDGGDGDDVVSGGPGADELVEQRFGRDRLDGGDGDDVVFGGRGEDQLWGGPGDDVLAGGSGPDVVDCGPGEDIVYVNFSRETRQTRECEEIHFEAGVTTRPCSLGGTDGPETVLGTQAADVCRGGAGEDDVEGAGGDDLLDGGAGDDRIFGRFGVDRLHGGAGDDELEGGRGRDVLEGGAGEDRLNGGYDPDVVRGGAGRDRVIARGGGADRIDCGPGRDVAYVDSADRVRGCERVERSGARR